MISTKRLPSTPSISTSLLLFPQWSESVQLTQTQKSQHLYFGPFRLGQTLGEGEFGKVKLATYQQRQFAIKFIRKSILNGSPKRLEKLGREIQILQRARHPFIVSLFSVLESEKYVGLVMEYAQNGELFDHILAHRFLREHEAKRLFCQLVSGVDYLHQMRVVHRDLKLENLLLDQHRNVKITDFGFANYDCSVQREQFLRTSCGSPCYAAPELVLGDGYKGAAADIWSCGVILYAMLCGFLPFDDDPENPDSSNVNKLYQYIMSTALTFPAHVPSLAQELILKMLNPNPEERYSMSEIYTHPWVADTFRQQQLLRSTPPPSVSMENEEEQDDENKENDSVSNRDSRSMSVPAVTPFTAPAKSRPPALHIKTDPILPNFLNRTSPYRPRAGSTPISGGEPAMITPNAQIPSATSSDSQTTASSTAIQSAGRHSLPPEKNGASMWKLFTKRHHQKAGTSTSVLPLHTPDAAFTTSFDAPCDRSSDDGARSSHELNIHRGALNQDLVSSVLTPYEMLSIVQDILMAAPTVSLSVSASSPTQLQPPERVHRRRQSGSLSSLNFMTNPPFYEGGMSESPVSSSFFCNGRVTMERSGDYEWTVTWVPLHPTATRSHHSSHEELRAMDMEMGKHGNSFGDRVRRSWHELRRSFAQLSLGGSMKQSDVKFTVEVCRLQNLPGVFCLNFKRLRGDLWQYKRIYKLCSEQFCNITNEKPVRQN